MFLKKLFIGSITILSTTCMFAQLPVDGFYPKKNSFTAALSYDYKSFEDFYIGEEIGNAPQAPFGEISSSIISIYSQYGITDRLSATLTLPYISSKGSIDGSVDGLQDLGLYLKGLITDKTFNNSSKLTIGGAMGVSFPISDYEGGGLLSIGNRATSVKSEAIVHYEVPFRAFAEVKVGSSVNVSDEYDIPAALLYSFKLGYIHKYFYTHAELDIQNSIAGTDIGGPNFGGPDTLPETQVDYTKLLFTVYVPVYEEMLGVSANYNTILDGRNFNNESGFGIGLVYNFN